MASMMEGHQSLITESAGIKVMVINMSYSPKEFKHCITQPKPLWLQM